MTFQHPAVLAVIPVLGALVWLLERRLPAPRGRRIARWASRTLLLALVAAAVAGPATERAEPLARRLVVAVDRAERLAAGAREEAHALVEALRRDAAARGVALTHVAYATEATAAGLARARLAIGEDERGGILLVTDGHGDMEGVAEAVAALGREGLAVTAAPVPRTVPAATMAPRIVALVAPGTARGPFAVRCAVEAADARALSLVLRVDGEERERRTVAVRPDGEAVFEALELEAGLHEIAVALHDESDPTAHDFARTLVEVGAPPRVLAVLADPAGSAWRRALSAQGLQVAAVEPADLADFVADGRPLPDVVLADAAGLVALPDPAVGLLRERVRAGLGLLVDAGGSAEAWEALGQGPLAALLPLRPLPEPPPPPPRQPPPAPPSPPPPPIEQPEPDPEPNPGLKAERRPEEALPITLLLVIDRSPSMAGPKMKMAIEGARQAAMALSPWDRIGVITFAHDSTLDVSPRSARGASSLPLWLGTVQAGGEGTNIFEALQHASRVLETERSPILHLVLLTDGQQWPDGPIFSPVVRPMRRRGITITSIGIGAGANLAQLRDIVQWAAAGTVIPVSDFSELPRVLTRDTQRVAKKRKADAEALDARLRDPDAKPRPPEPEPEPEPPAPPRPPDPPTPPADEQPPEPAPSDARLPLEIVRAHEALRGLPRGNLPAVGPPRRSEAAPDAAVLLRRADGAVVLAASRPGVGRVLAWALPPKDAGAAAWPALGQLFGQAARSALAPRGAFDYLPRVRVAQEEDGARVHVTWPRGETARRLRIRWTGAGETRDLGAFAPEDDPGGRLLPPAAPDTLCRLDLTLEPGPPLPAVSYLVAAPPVATPRAGDPERLAHALGAPLVAPAAFLASLPGGRRRVPTPRWPLFLWLAIGVLPADVWLHRRGRGDA